MPVGLSRNAVELLNTLPAATQDLPIWHKMSNI